MVGALALASLRASIGGASGLTVVPVGVPVAAPVPFAGGAVGARVLVVVAGTRSVHVIGAPVVAGLRAPGVGRRPVVIGPGPSLGLRLGHALR